VQYTNESVRCEQTTPNKPAEQNIRTHTHSRNPPPKSKTVRMMYQSCVLLCREKKTVRFEQVGESRNSFTANVQTLPSDTVVEIVAKGMITGVAAQGKPHAASSARNAFQLAGPLFL
jgi:hypothetical protein